MAGNIYDVGAAGISAHVITTPEGPILLDTGTREMLPGVRANIEKLGHKMSDVKIIPSSHAHWDHVENHAAMKKLTGAQIMAVDEDAAAISAGSTIPLSAGTAGRLRRSIGFEGWRHRNAGRRDRESTPDPGTHEGLHELDDDCEGGRPVLRCGLHRRLMCNAWRQPDAPHTTAMSRRRRTALCGIYARAQGNVVVKPEESR